MTYRVPKYSHGHASRGQHSLTYRRWSSMMRRSGYDSSLLNEDYAGSGIVVCERWKFFSLFLKDMSECVSENLTLDRIDNSKGYEPGNCRWATRTEQNYNRNSLTCSICGSDQHTARGHHITSEMVQDILDSRSRGESQQSIADRLGVHRSTVRRVQGGKYVP